MFSVIYLFTIKPGFDETFQREWIEGTREIIKQHGGQGARLHRSSTGDLIAYAQWPSRESWKEFEQSHDMVVHAAMHECCLGVKTLYELDVLADLLVSPQRSDSSP